MQSTAPIFLAFRYLRPKRSFVSVITFISILGVMLGVGVLVVVMSVFKGWQIEFKKLVLGFEPHLVLMQDPPHQGPVDPNQPPVARSQWRDVIEIVRQHPQVAAAEPIATGAVAAECSREPLGMEIIGLQPVAGNAQVKKLSRHLKAGVFDLESDNIVLTDKQAEAIGAKLGDKVLLTAAGTIEQITRDVRDIERREQDEEKRVDALGEVIVLSQETTLTGILRSDTGGSRGYVPLNIAQELFNLEDRVSEIEIELRNPDHADEIADEWMSGDFIPLDWSARTWMDEHSFMLQNVENQQSLMWFLLLFVMIVAATCVMNTTITVTVQKRREIGILTALGSRARQIIGIFLAQAAVVAGAGCVLGLTGGFVVLHYRNDLREFFSRATGRDFFPQDIYFLSSIPAHIQAGDLLSICAAAIVLCLFAALAPAYFAARVDPAVALRD